MNEGKELTYEAKARGLVAMTKKEKMEELYELLNSFSKERLAFFLQVAVNGRIYPKAEENSKKMVEKMDKATLVTHAFRKWSQLIK